MKKSLTSTQVKWIAEGCWNHYFNCRFHPKVKRTYLIAFITFVSGLAVAIGIALDSTRAIGTSTAPSAVVFVAMALVLVGAGFLFKGFWVSQAEKNKFIDVVVGQFEKGNTAIPDAEAVQKFIESG